MQISEKENHQSLHEILSPPVLCFGRNTEHLRNAIFIKEFECFNPWFVGSRIQTQETFPVVSTHLSFNPWFVGSRIQTIAIWFHIKLLRVFQSLICWKSDSDFHTILPNNPWLEFQSLICWKSDSDLCCFWYSILISIVSILDLLEVGFRRSIVHRSGKIRRGFNPWFVGSRIQTAEFVSVIGFLISSFNPWFVGSRIQTFFFTPFSYH